MGWGRLVGIEPDKNWGGGEDLAAFHRSGQVRHAESPGMVRCAMRIGGVPWVMANDFYQKPAPTLSQVSAYFVEALGENPKVDGERRLRFERWQGFAWGTSWRRCVLSGVYGGGVCLEWWANDDFGLSELREFFEAPFFDVSEAQRFHSWFSEGGWHRGELRGCPMSMGTLSRGDYVYVRLRWWMPDD